MAVDLSKIARELSNVLQEEVLIQQDVIILGGSNPADFLLLQVGANDGRLYLSAPIAPIDENQKNLGAVLSTLLELSGDVKEYPGGRIIFNPDTNNADWLEVLEFDESIQALVEQIQKRGQLIQKIRQAISVLEEA